MKKELKILGLSYSQSQIGSYIIILSDKTGNRKLPIVIKTNEAQKIAIELEGIKNTRPMVHDVFKMLTDGYMIDIQEVFIHNLLEGVFYTKIITSNGLDSLDIECTVGDALAFASIYNCPIYTTSDILDIAGVSINDDGSIIDDNIDEKRVVSVEDLERMMNDALNNEDYEMAAELRDKIQKMKG